MNTISYKQLKNGSVRVYVEGKAVGYLRESVSLGHCYETNSGERGEFFKTQAELCVSLESPIESSPAR